MDEAALVAALRRGEPRGLHEAWSRHRARIYGFLLRLSRRRDVAEELLQETFLSLAKAAPRLQESTDLAALLFTIARNQWRSHRRWSFLDLSRWVPIDDHPGVASEGDPDADLDARRRVHDLERALASLSTRDREVLLLVGVEGFDTTQAAEILGIRADALRQRLSRARAKLEDALVSNSPRRQVQRA
ncbi:MAG: RNA polymerase sigma factor [Polyangiales bacterium]